MHHKKAFHCISSIPTQRGFEPWLRNQQLDALRLRHHGRNIQACFSFWLPLCNTLQRALLIFNNFLIFLGNNAKKCISLIKPLYRNLVIFYPTRCIYEIQFCTLTNLLYSLNSILGTSSVILIAVHSAKRAPYCVWKRFMKRYSLLSFAVGYVAWE